MPHRPWAYLRLGESGPCHPLRKPVIKFGRDGSKVDIKVDFKPVSSIHGTLTAPPPNSNLVRLECHGQNGIIVQVSPSDPDEVVIRQVPPRINARTIAPRVIDPLGPRPGASSAGGR